MTQMVFIGVPACPRDRTERYFGAVGVRETYLQSVEAAGAVPLMLPFTDSQNVLRAAYDTCAGILLTGGNDVDPALYGEAPHEKLEDTFRERDDIEAQIVRWCVEDKKPLLAICRGMQLVNVALGGSLYQDIPAQLPLACRHGAEEKRESWCRAAHALKLEADSRLVNVLGLSEIQVNSLHHQAVKDVAQGLRVAGRSEDGLIEALESDAGQFLVALQCHPEAMWQSMDGRWLSVFKALVEEAKRFS